MACRAEALLTGREQLPTPQEKEVTKRVMTASVRRAITLTLPLLSVKSISGFSPIGGIASTGFWLRSSTTTAMASSTNCQSSWSYQHATRDGGSLEVVQFSCLGDNYGYIIHDPSTGETAAIDTPCATSYKNELQKRGWKLTHILNTHHHHDHVGGNLELKTAGVKVYGPAHDGNIPGMDVSLNRDDIVSFGGTNATVLDVGGHTVGHIAFHFPQEKTAFVGDSLFALGCGRMFEGTPLQFWGSLQRLRSLPDDTTIYCAHEYTESNAKFAMSVEPKNSDLVKRVEEIKAKRTIGEPTVPSMMGIEKLTNPFLRGDVSEEIRQNVDALDGDDDAQVFAKIREGKDKFRG